jgi:hypothetical protein
MAGISWSVSPGTTGATMTRTGTPAADSFSIASSRRRGDEVRGSIFRWSVSSSEVTEKLTGRAVRRGQLSQQVRVAGHQVVLGDDAHGVPHLGQRLQAPAREAQSSLGTGWYGSVTPLITMVCGFHRGDASSRRSSSGASIFTRMRVSKSSPAEKPRYSCVGRAKQ